ncbi:CGP-CTERM sorting domain-containing protein [Thermococcus celer]|uniref:Uncharacterized protein n=1 Tax=Thermococcus celer Vu 13 = JCM 8558 TaxID=1293037 RepID=A0A218P299_THECE|nr:CGP-CTERM sorting domain-containing protein [Thermococcus celer]ASI99047.1 hypothetical protein A3L02_05440 [Thermococcus celer Vu 13 = JCM 8558]
MVLVDVPQELQTELEGMNLTVKYVKGKPEESDYGLIAQVLGLYGPYSLGEALTVGNPIQYGEISRRSPDKLTAEQEASKVYTVLKSGSLPVKLTVVKIETVSTEPGETATTNPSTSNPNNIPKSRTNSGGGICGPGTMIALAIMPLLTERKRKNN